MAVALKPELERFVDEQVRSGRFASVAEVLEAGVARLMLDPLPDELDDDDIAAIEESEGQIARGKDVDWGAASAKPAAVGRPIWQSCGFRGGAWRSLHRSPPTAAASQPSQSLEPLQQFDEGRARLREICTGHRLDLVGADVIQQPEAQRAVAMESGGDVPVGPPGQRNAIRVSGPVTRTDADHVDHGSPGDLVGRSVDERGTPLGLAAAWPDDDLNDVALAEARHAASDVLRPPGRLFLSDGLSDGREEVVRLVGPLLSGRVVLPKLPEVLRGQLVQLDLAPQEVLVAPRGRGAHSPPVVELPGTGPPRRQAVDDAQQPVKEVVCTGWHKRCISRGEQAPLATNNSPR